MILRYFQFFILCLSLLYLGNIDLKAASKGELDTETPASEVVPSSSYKSSEVGDFYVSPNINFGLSKLSKPSMKGSGIFFSVAMDHLSNGALGNLLPSENSFSFTSFEYSLGELWFSKEKDEGKLEVNVFVPIQIMLKRSFGIQSSKSGILSMVQLGVGGLMSTNIEGVGMTLTPEEEQNKIYKKEDNLDDWAVGFAVTGGYEMSIPVISYTGLFNIGFKWTLSVVDISGKLNIKDVNEKFITPGHLTYNYIALYTGMRFSL